ncbi:uracil-DNA glycosylase family protein [Compostibacter hankyongensis]|uniref:SMUG2 DNA glycosylase family protein n=1 Tax=Compostibacter hankyongensis TaxID=1007089 RepID=A0ABP8G125_9BACT
MTFAEKAIRFHRQLEYTGAPLPPDIRVMNPFQTPGPALQIMETFYRKYFSDNRPRRIILGINPGRFGAGLTGIPFTDPKRLQSECGIGYEGKITHEPSSVFVYEVINAYGGAEAFYRDLFINSPCPLGFTSVDAAGREKNYNYYDSRELLGATEGFIIESIGKLIALGIKTDVCFCFGSGKNGKFLRRLNDEQGFFKKIIPLEHPRFIMQYRYAQRQSYIDKYLAAFSTLS